MSRLSLAKSPGRWLPLCLAATWAIVSSQAALGQLPTARLNSVFPAGGKAGSTVEVTITGIDLEQADKLLFSHAGITAAPKTRDANPFEQGPQVVPNQFVVKIDAGAPPGHYDARVVGRFGISNPRSFIVDDQNEVLEKEPNNAREQAAEAVAVGSIVNGQMNGGADIDYFKLAAKKGQRIIIDCWGSRIDSRLDGMLAVYDPSGRELESNRDTNYRDPFIDFTAPADADYFIRLHDAVYGGSPNHFYRLVISTKPYIDYVLPNAILPGTTGAVTLFGRNLPGGADAGVQIDGKPLQKLAVQVAAPGGPEAERLNVGTFLEPESSSIDGFEYRFRGPTGASNPVFLGFAAAPVAIEQEPNGPDKPQRLNVPCEFVGQSQSPRDQDYLLFDAKANDVYWIEMISQRQGVPLDPYFLVQRVMPPDKEGKPVLQDIAANDDSMANIGGTSFNTQCDDPSFRFVAPADGTYRVLIRDLYNRGNARYVYRLAIRKEQPDFRLAAVPVFPNSQQQGANLWTTLLRRGGHESLDILAFRRDGFNGEIEVSVEGLPAGVTYRPITLGPGQSSTDLVLSAADNAADWAGTIRVGGKAKINGKDVVREARGGTVLWPAQQNQTAPARLTRQIALAVTSKETADFQVNIGDGKVLEMSRGGRLEVPVKAVRRNNFNSSINLVSANRVQNIQIQNIALAGGADGKLNINLPVNVQPGTYSFSMLGQTQLSYKRNEDLAKAAEEEKKRVDKIVTDLTAEAKRLADVAAKAAADAKAAAQKAATDAANKLKAAQDFQRQVTQRATELRNAANARQMNVFVPSSSFTIKVTESPITFAANQNAAQLKQNDKLEVPVNVNRLYGYNDPIQVELVLPGSVGGVKANALQIAAGQNQGKLVIEAAANATPGNHTFTIRAAPRLNGQALPITQTIPVTIQAVEPPKKK